MVREEDLLTTHTLIPPQANRSSEAAHQLGGELAARVVDEDDNGVVIRGARMLATIGPIADELLVFPSTVLRGKPEDAPYSYAVAVPCDAPGLRFVCRESMDYGRSHFDHPLGSRFEEMDAVVIFDDVHVPYERCFMLGNPELCNAFYTETSAVVHMTHQVTTRTTAKTEFILGLLSLMTEGIGIERLPARAGEHRRGDRRAGDRQGPAARRRGRREAEPVRRHDPEMGAAERLPQLVPEDLPAVPRDPAQARRRGLMALPTEADITARRMTTSSAT